MTIFVGKVSLFLPLHAVNMDIIVNVVTVYLFDCLQRCVMWIGFSVGGHITEGIPEHKGLQKSNDHKWIGLYNAWTFPCTDCID